MVSFGGFLRSAKNSLRAPFCLCSFGRELVLGISMVSFGGFLRSAKNSLRASLKGVRILEQWPLFVVLLVFLLG